MSTKLNQLRELRNHAVKSMRDLHDAAEKESRGFTADEQQNFDNARAKIDDIEARMKRESDLVDAESRSAKAVEGTHEDRDAQATGSPSGDEHSKAFRSYLVGGQAGLSASDHKLLSEKRDLSLTGAAGGFTVPTGFLATLIEAQRSVGGFLQDGVSTILETDSGNPMPVPLEDDTANAATIVAEGASLTASVNPVFSQLTLGAFTYRSLVRVSLELLQDSAFDIEAYVARKLGVRLARGFNAHASTGTGTGQPQGLFNATVGAPIGVTAPAGQANTWAYQSLVNIEHSVDPDYRANSKWMFNDAVLQALKNQLDSTGRPIWMPDYAVAAAVSGVNSGRAPFPGRILGYEYIINQDAPVPAANARSIAFGDLSTYMVRRIRNMMLVRADQRFIDQGQIGFYVFARMDGRYANPTAVAARAPIRLGQNSAT